MTLIIPALQTERLTLDASRESDFEDEEAEGRGYAYEAGAAMRDWAFDATDLRTLVSYIDPANRRAIQLARRLGGRPTDGPAGVSTFRYLAPGAA